MGILNEEKTIDELQKELADAKNAYEKIKEFVAKKEREEADRRKKELQSKKEERYKEVVEAAERFNTLAAAYQDDYGTTGGGLSFSFPLPHDWGVSTLRRLWGL